MIDTAQLVSEHPLLERPRILLADYLRTTPQLTTVLYEIKPYLSSVKRTAVANGDQQLAKAVWCLETIAGIQRDYLKVFTLLRKSHFYAAWCGLETVELKIRALDQHFRPTNESYGLEFIRVTTVRLQSLFPYALFVSPEILKREVRCGICDAIISLRSRCEHQLGEIYDGARCFHKVTKSEFLGLSIVHNPVQKYSVLFKPDPAVSGGKPNKEAYPLLRYLINGLASPWDVWTVEQTTTLHPHSQYEYVAPGEECPCVSPQGTYAQCCLQKKGVLRPHVVVHFSVPPPSKFLKRTYI